MTESLNNKSKVSLTEALKAEYSNASIDDQVIMKETLDNLDIKIECNNENCTDITDESESSDELETKDEEANNVGSDQLVESLQEAIKAKSDLEAKIQNLQSELAVSNTKVEGLNEELKQYKANAARLSSLVTEGKEEAKKVSILEAKLNDREEKIKILESKVNELTVSVETKDKALNESVTARDSQTSVLNENLTMLREKLCKLSEEYDAKIKTLKEDFAKKENQLTSNINDLTQKLANSTNLAEGYKKTATSIANSYIEEKARLLDVKKEEIINKLPKKYSIKDINAVCESLKKYSLNMRKLPFNLDGSIEKVAITESSDESIKTRNNLVDDEVDDMLLNLVSKK